MQGKATIARHPLHPALVTIPIGCFVAAVISDIISIWTDPGFLARMSTWLIAFGFASSLIAAFFGFVDYLSAPMSMKARGVAGWHMTLNGCVVVIFGVALALRSINMQSPAGYAMTGLGLVILLVAAYLGGELSHRYLVGAAEEEVGEPRWPADQTSGV